MSKIRKKCEESEGKNEKKYTIKMRNTIRNKNEKKVIEVEIHNLRT